MRILLAGATGFLGFRTLELLVQNPAIECIVATGRTINPVHHLLHPKIKYQLGDLRDAEWLDKLAAGADQIINAAALSSPWGKYEEFHQANVITQRNLIQTAHNHGVKRFIYISSPSIYFNGKDRLGIKESDPLPLKFVNDYAATKRKAELQLENSGLEFITLRPRALIGRGDTIIMPRVIKTFLEKKLRVIGDGTNSVDLTSVANAALAIEASIFAGNKAINQAYNISNGKPVKLWDCIDAVLSHLGHVFEHKRVPYFLASLAARLMEVKSRMTDHQEPVLTVYGIGILAQSFTMDISKAKELLNYRPLVSVDDSIVEFVTWYKTLQ